MEGTRDLIKFKIRQISTVSPWQEADGQYYLSNHCYWTSRGTFRVFGPRQKKKRYFSRALSRLYCTSISSHNQSTLLSFIDFIGLHNFWHRLFVSVPRIQLTNILNVPPFAPFQHSQITLPIAPNHICLIRQLWRLFRRKVLLMLLIVECLKRLRLKWTFGSAPTSTLGPMDVY